jgi:hypothetical protein
MGMHKGSQGRQLPCGKPWAASLQGRVSWTVHSTLPGLIACDPRLQYRPLYPVAVGAPCWSQDVPYEPGVHAYSAGRPAGIASLRTFQSQAFLGAHYVRAFGNPVNHCTGRPLQQQHHLPGCRVFCCSMRGDACLPRVEGVERGLPVLGAMPTRGPCAGISLGQSL